MKDGYIRVAAASFDTSIANVKNNGLKICKLINDASRIVFNWLYM